MPININGTWRSTVAWWTKVSGTWKEGTGVFTKVAGVWREEQFTEPLGGFIDPAFVSGFTTSPGTATTGLCSSVISGGAPPYNYAWLKVSGLTMTVNSPNGPDTTFSNNVGGVGIYNLFVQDSLGAVFFTNTVAVTITIE